MYTECLISLELHAQDRFKFMYTECLISLELHAQDRCVQYIHHSYWQKHTTFVFQSKEMLCIVHYVISLHEMTICTWSVAGFECRLMGHSEQWRNIMTTEQSTVFVDVMCSLVGSELQSHHIPIIHHHPFEIFRFNMATEVCKIVKNTFVKYVTMFRHTCTLWLHFV
jgi:hypothetical protein